MRFRHPAPRCTARGNRLLFFAVTCMIFLLAGASLIPCAAKENRYDPTTLVFPPFGHTMGFHKVREMHLKIFLGSERSFDRPTGISAVKLTSKDDPKKSGDDDELTIFGLNSGKGEIIYNTSKLSAAVYGKRGSGQGEFLDPLAIAADPDGHVFVADTGNDRIVHLEYDGRANHLEEVDVLPATFLGLPLSAPSGIEMDCSGRLYTADRDNDRIVCTDYRGKLFLVIDELQSGKKLRKPGAIAVTDKQDRWLYYKRSFLFAVDSDGHRIVKLTPEGKLAAEIASDAIPGRNACFKDIAVDYYSNIYVTDMENGCIYKFDRKLNFITRFGRSGKKDKEFDKPWGVTIWKRFGQVFVSERKSAQYYWIGVDFGNVEILEATTRGGMEITKFSISITEPANLSVRIENTRGELLWDRFRNEKCRRTLNIIPWERVDNDGKLLPPGEYLVSIEARATYSSKKYFSIRKERTITIE